MDLIKTTKILGIQNGIVRLTLIYNIDFSLFFFQFPGNGILKEPYETIQYEFPITSCSSPNAILSLSFLFIPKIYRPIQFKDYSNTLIHIWATFTPSIAKFDNQIEIELLQASTLKDRKFNTGYFFNLNHFHSWESVGSSSSTCTFLGQTGFTPIKTFSIDKISEKVNFLIVNVSNYKGVISLNFIVEKKGNEVCIEDKFYISVKNVRDHSIGTVKTVDISVEPNKKYCAPIYLHCEEKIIKSTFEIKEFPNLVTHNYQYNDFTDQICSEIPFDYSIIEVAQTEVECLKNVTFMKTFTLPIHGQISIQKIFNEFNIHSKSKIRIYINGLSTNTTSGSFSDINFWKPFFKIFNKTNGHLCREISQNLLNPPYYHFRALNEDSQIPINWHTYVDLDLDEIGTEKVVIFNIKCHSSFKSANSSGVIYIAHVDGDKETLLFRNPIVDDSDSSYCGILMRFEFIKNEWFIVPMKYFFNKKKNLDLASFALFRNNWVLPQSLLDNIDEITLNNSSDGEFLLDEMEPLKI